MPIQIKGTDFIAGWYGYEACPDDMKNIISRKENVCMLQYISEEDLDLKSKLDNEFLLQCGFCGGHTCIDYKTIAEKGVNFYINKVGKELLTTDAHSDKYIYLKAMLISLKAIETFSKRFAELAFSMAENAKSFEEKERLMRMHNALLKVPMNPSGDFYEALQAVWIMHLLIPISEHDWASISLGRFDQYLYPFYKKSIESGETRETIVDYLKNLFVLLDSYGDGACALNIGGMDMQGHDQMNELSDIIIDVEKQMRLRAPILAARINQNTPKNIMDKLVDSSLFEIGQPTFYGEAACRKAVANRGIEEAIAAQFSANSCMGLVIAGEEIADMWGCLFNMHLPLELAINKGKPLFGELPVQLKTKPLEEIQNIEQLFLQYGKYLKELLQIVLNINRKTALNYAYNFSDPLLSAITKDCIEKGMDRAIGAKYKNVTVEAMGMINTGNAITAIDTLIFHKKKYSSYDIINGAKNDFVGYEELKNDIRFCEKYGANSKKPDEICGRLTDILANICEQLNFDNTRYLPSLHTLDNNVYYGKRLYTTLDGRMKGEPVNKNAGPTNDVRKSEPTSMIISAASLNQYKFSGGQPIDIYFDKKSLSTVEKRDKIKVLIKTYFELGGMQIQVNSIDSHTLESAFENPDEYKHLIVRIGGYSMRFCDLSNISKLELIERIKYEEA